ncbi:MAG: acetylglutamate kinase, partial [Gordonia polyisoprenivorans]|nr:acetylglutamate kinase [Gordonia polyisoprenivorans]
STEIVRQIDTGELAALLPSLESGMVPKMEACLRAVTGGVGAAHVIDGRVPHAVLAELLTSSSAGTTVVPYRTGAGSVTEPASRAHPDTSDPKATTS